MSSNLLRQWEGLVSIVSVPSVCDTVGLGQGILYYQVTCLLLVDPRSETLLLRAMV